nr:hypothetical protein [Tanacetum cinerariifolium]
MPPKSNLVFNTASLVVESDHLAFNVQLSLAKPAQPMSHTTKSMAPIIEDWVFDSEDESEPNDPQSAPSFVQPSKHVKPSEHSAQPVEAPILDHTPKPTSSKTNGSRKRKNRKTCFVCRGVDHLIKDYTFHAKPKTQPTPRNYAHMGYYKQYASSTKKYPQKHRVHAAVSTKSKPVSVTATRTVSATVPKIMATKPRHAHSLHKKTKLIIRRHQTPSKFSKTSNSSPKVTTAHAKVVSATKGMKGKWGNPQYALKDKGVIDSGCSRHMTGNMSYLSDFQELMEDILPLEVIPRVLPDESQVLLRVPRENNMYNVNLKDIIPSGDLTCPFAKATIDESNLWHRRLRHVNFKTINKLVKGNLVRGLPTKVFENQNTCVACMKGKQHRASCKTKPVSSVTQSFFRLYMDLFGPTFVKSLSKKCYCLVITDDYSRFTWVFFLATKDETSSILKTFVTGLENQLSLKVKVIGSDNETEFKNSDHNQFCEIKGIRREFSVPRTPQQNGIAERKNRTLIEAVRTMLADSLLPIPFSAEAVNTACYVQNRVLLTKPQNKTPYELLHGRTPSIGFIRPFGCPVTILNTLDSLGKFEGKVDEGFLVGYSVNRKAFIVFNSQTRIVQKTLHVNFLENISNVAGFQENFNEGKTGEEADLQYMLFPVWSTGSTNLQNKEVDATFDAEKPKSIVNLSPSNSALSREHDDITKKKDKGKSHVDYFTGNRDFNEDFEDYSEDSSNDVSATGPIFPTAGKNYSNSTNPISAAGPIVNTAGQNYSNNTNPISAAGPIVNTTGQNYSNNTNPISAAGPSNSNTHGQSSLLDTYQPPDMVEKEDIDYSNVGAETDFNNLETSIIVSPIPTTRIHNAHPISQIIGNLSSTTQTRSMARITRDQGGISQILNEDFHTFMFACFLSQEEPKRKVWILVDLPHGKRAISTKWVYRNKKDERGIVVRNKARLVAQGHTQEEGIDYEEVFAPVARIEAIRFFLDYASFMGFIVYQMDIKSEILYGTIEEEAYVCQPPGFEDPDYPDKEDGIFINQDKYVVEILKKFGLTKGKSTSTPIDTEKPSLKDPDGEDVGVHIYRFMIGSLRYLTSSRPDIMLVVCACARFQVTPKVSHLHAVKRIFRYLMGKPNLGLWYLKDSPFDLVAYSDSDYAGASLDRKSTSRGCQFLGSRLISWQCKKQTVVATSSTEAEYVAGAS